METHAHIPTAHASRYLQQLCKHWSHRFDVTFTPVVGRIPLAEDRACTLEADADGLKLTLVTPDAETNTRMQGVVFDHLKRFAFREELVAPEWR